MVRLWNGLLVLLFVTFVSVGCGRGGATSLENPDRKHERRLQPAIAFIETTLAEYRRLPTHDEFFRWNEQVHGMFVLRDRSSRYAASKGAKGVNDYMVGVWRADWYHYYKSWDKSYLNASDEPLFEDHQSDE